MLARNKDLSDPRLGIIVAKKHVKLAVQRNRIKRLLRESFRCKRHSLPKIDMVILAKKSADKLDSAVCAEEIQYLWRKLSRKLATRDQQ